MLLLEIIFSLAIMPAIKENGKFVNILPRRFNRVKEGDRTFCVTTSICWNHRPLRIRTSASVFFFLKNALYTHLKLCQIRGRIFNSFLSNHFLHCNYRSFWQLACKFRLVFFNNVTVIDFDL